MQTAAGTLSETSTDINFLTAQTFLKPSVLSKNPCVSSFLKA